MPCCLVILFTIIIIAISFVDYREGNEEKPEIHEVPKGNKQ